MLEFQSRGGGSDPPIDCNRLNATFGERLAPLARRCRALARHTRTLHEGMFVVGTVYNFAQFIAVCRRSKFGYTRTSRLRRGSPLCTRLALKRRGDTQRLSQVLRATKCDKLSAARRVSCCC